MPPIQTLNTIFSLLHSEEHRPGLERLREIVSSHAAEIAEVFYQRMLEEPGAASFLSHELVQTRLTFTMVNWLKELFQPLNNDEEIEAYIERQLRVGRVHARIDLPVILIGYGVFVLKREIARHVCEAMGGGHGLGPSLELADLIVDASVVSINRAYFADANINAQSMGCLQLHATSQFLALECERLRSSLSEWLSAVLLALQRKAFAPGSFPPICSSDLSLWLSHKADLVFPNRPELADLRRQALDMDQIAEELCRQTRESGEPPPGLVDELQIHVRRASWLLARMSQEVLELENSKDALTRLLSRRYLSAILQHEVRHSFASGTRFSLLMVDVDHFKQVNDSFGHAVGDLALKFVASQIMDATRVGDQIFRYGGEEFLVVLVECGVEMAVQVADKIRRRVAESDLGEHDFGGKAAGLRLTVSIGASVYDGHPDYQLTVERADAALYRAKQQGRNCIVLDEQSRNCAAVLRERPQGQ